MGVRHSALRVALRYADRALPNPILAALLDKFTYMLCDEIPCSLTKASHGSRVEHGVRRECAIPGRGAVLGLGFDVELRTWLITPSVTTASCTYFM